MKRRSFLKKTAAAGLVTWITPSSLLTIFKNSSPTVNKSFDSPSREYAPYTWWHWMNGNISKEGITLDLEAMSDAGLGGFQMFEVGTGIPKGPVSYLSKEWLSLIEHTVTECKRLGLEFAMHNCPGWSSSGGPWITPQLAMQQLTWSEVTLTGGKKFKGILPQPTKRLNYYQDSALIAFPALPEEKVGWASLLKEIKINDQPISLEALSPDGQFKDLFTVGKADTDGFLDLAFVSPYQLSSITLLSTGNGKLVLQYSKDGSEFITIKELRAEGSSAPSFPDYTFANVSKITAPYYRLAFRGTFSISMLSLSGSHKLDNWLSKANYPGIKPAAQSVPVEFTRTSSINISSVIDLTAKLSATGELEWDVPPGEWTILRIGHTAVGRLNHSAPSNGTGLDCDKFSKEAFDFHWQHVFKSILPLLTSRTGGKVGSLIDSYEMGLQNWSSTFPAEFAKRQKYSITSYLPALTGRLVGDEDMTERFLRDFRRAQADVMAENYYGRFAELCKANGIISYTEPYEGGNFEEMQIGRAVDISMGEFWAGHTMLYRNSVLDRTIKLASSIAHSKGELVVAAEAYTAEPASGKWQQYPFAMKGIGDLMFTKGLTRMIFHRFAHQPHPDAMPGMTMGPWGIHYDRTNTWFSKSKEWITYLSRCQYMLRQGIFVADIAYYTGEDVPGKTIKPEETKYRPPAGYDYDLINSDCLLKECVMADGRLENKHGVRYKAIVLPDVAMVSLAVLRKLHSLVMDGLVLIGSPPSKSFGVNDRLSNIEFEGLITKLWRGPAHVGKGQVIQRTDIQQIMLQVGIEPDFTYTADSTDPAINFIHRAEKDQDIYFVANRRRRPENATCSFRITGKTPELWDAVTGAITPVVFYHVQGNRTYVSLQMAPLGSAFIVFKPEKPSLAYQALYRDGLAVITTEQKKRQPRGMYAKTSGDFAITCWVKPEIDIVLTEEGFFGDRKTDHYAIHPVPGERYYGKGHAGSGMTVGRNGVTIFERLNDVIQAVLFVEAPISGWTRLTVRYEKNRPSVYLNNNLIKTGNASAYIVHPSVNEAYQDEGASYYNGELYELELINCLITETEATAYSLILPTTDVRSSATIAASGKLCIWNNGQYQLKSILGKVQQFTVKELPKVKEIQKGWLVKFPKGLGAPDQIELDELIPLQKHQNQGVKYFSGTATYLNDFHLDLPNFSYQVKLDLGRVEVLAKVSVNGVNFPVVWTQPYQVDITAAIRPGINNLVMEVTNLWPNRLIGDENLAEENEYIAPKSSGKFALASAGGIKKLPDWYVNRQPKPTGGRVTFTTWKHYDKDSPLLESGLLGPVTISVGILKDLNSGSFD